MVEAYARAARDPNPLHTDPAYAATTPFGRPIAHGMLVLALVAEAMAEAFGEEWASGGTLNVKWRVPAVHPLTVTVRAALRSDTAGVATYEVTCEDETGSLLLTGTASARYSPLT
jgi:3-hydroxybutyryl-CoA dehydratase